MNKIQEIRAQAIKDHKEFLTYLDNAEAEIGPIMEGVEKLNPQHVYCNTGCLNINIVGDKHKLNAVFGLLRRAGYEPSSRPEPKSSTYNSFFHKEGVSENIWLAFSSTQCRRVKVRTETVTEERDIYETVCDEQEYPETQSADAMAEAL